MTHILFAVLVLALLALAFGIILGFAAVKFHVEADPIVDQLDALLPQTQCGQCGYPGCKPYAEALANGDQINKCVPGGDATMRKIADLMGLNPSRWAAPKPPPPSRKSLSFMKINASAAPSASRPVRSMPSSAPPRRCTPSLPTSAPAAISVSIPARPTVSK